MPSVFQQVSAMVDEYNDIKDESLLVCNICRYLACILCLGATGLTDCPSELQATCTKWKELID